MKIIFWCCVIIIYFALGTFFDVMIEDEPSIVTIIFWPLGLLLFTILFFCVYVPTEFATWVKKKFKRKRRKT